MNSNPPSVKDGAVAKIWGFPAVQSARKTNVKTSRKAFLTKVVLLSFPFGEVLAKRA
jgi:hypothetical protein